jgi:hypothetical protein
MAQIASQVSVSPLGEVEVLPLADLTPYPANARKITKKAVALTALSLREFGWQQPIVADVGKIIVAGHVRHRAALSLGETHGPVVIAGTLTPAQIRAYRIADNRTHDYTTWDYGMLADELAGVEDGFAEVLDLADWQGLVQGFTASQEQTREPLMDDPETAALLGGGYTVMVVFTSREDADAAGPALLQVPGVVNVRHPH